MSKSLRKDFQREIKKNISRFISILLIVVLGVAFYSGIRSAMPAMQETADKTYDKEYLMDIRVSSTLGLTSADLEAIKELDGVLLAESSYSTDFVCLANSSEVVTKIISMPEKINDIKLIKGRFPEKYNEIVVSPEFLEATGFDVDSYVTFITGTEEKVTATLASESFQIVGVCTSSYFLNGDMGTSTVGDGMVDGFAVIPREAFVTEYYTSIYILVDGARELNCYSDEYKKEIDKVISQLETIEEKRCDIRYSEVRAESAELLNDARDEYNSKYDLVMSQLAEYKEQLLSAEVILLEKENDFKEQKTLLENAETELPLRKQQIAEAEAEIAEGEAQLKRQETALAQNKVRVDEARAEYEKLEADPNTTPEQLKDAKDSLLLVEKLYETLEAEINSYRTQLEDAKEEIAEGKQTIAEVEKILANDSVITDAEKQLTDARIELDRAKEKYETQEEEATKELADASEQLEKAQREIEDMKVPEWYKLDRTSIESYASFQNDTESIGAIGTVFPIIFFLVAALVSLTTMTRMVEEQRTQIGTLKALGYSKLTIAGKYLLYALFATILGSIIGVFVGEFTLPNIIITAYKSVYYNLGENVVNLNIEHALVASLAAVLCTSFAAFSACYKELKSAPAQLMRPEAPRAGKRIFLENISPIWDRLNFGQKAAVRNLFRYKKRFFMTLFGVGGCMALLLVGLGIRDSVSAMANNQYKEVFKYDGIVSIDSTLTRMQHQVLNEELGAISDIEGLKATRTMVYGSATGKSDDENEKYAYMVVPADADILDKYISLNERTGLSGKLELNDEGVIITEKFANMLGVEKGDNIFIKLSENDQSPKQVKVTGVTENYIFNYIYMTPSLYKTIYTVSPDINSIFIKTADAVNEDDLVQQILNVNGVNSVTMNSTELDELNQIVNMLYFIIVIMIFAAGLLAFIVLYNLNNINISERRRELATLKLLGFYDVETATYVYRENIVLTILGTILGIFLGIVLHRFVMTTVETDIYMFGRELSPLSIVIGAALTIIFAIIVNGVMFFKLKKIDMIESLKSVE